MGNKELLKRIDERNYLTEREHREFLSVLNKELERLKKQDKILELFKTWLVYDEYEDTIMTYRDIPLDIKEKIMRWLDNDK